VVVLVYLPRHWLSKVEWSVRRCHHESRWLVDLDIYRSRKGLVRGERALLQCECDLDLRHGAGFLPVMRYRDGIAFLESLVCVKCDAKIAVQGRLLDCGDGDF
jgi:hypothetical protein